MPENIPIQFLRGTQAAVLAVVNPPAGKPLYATDTKHVFIGDGSGVTLAGRALQGTLVSRPAAGLRGQWYFATDNSNLYYDDGSAWKLISGGGSSFDEDTILTSVIDGRVMVSAVTGNVLRRSI